jgi:hypothetical protein
VTVGSLADDGFSIVSDLDGNAYVTGRVSGPNFPTTPGAHDRSFNGNRDAFLTKLSPSGDLLFSTYLGGSSFEDGVDIGIDGTGRVLVAGWTGSRAFAEPFSAIGVLGSDDAFLAVFDGSNGHFLSLTLLGGSQGDYALAVASTRSPGVVALAGYTTSTNFPDSPEAGQRALGGTRDGFVALIDTTPTLPTSVYATYLGGAVRPGISATDKVFDVALDACGNVVVTGSTVCTDFPTTAGAFQSSFPGNTERAFVSKIHTSSRVRIADVATRPERDVEIQVFARSCKPLAALSLVLEVPLTFVADQNVDILAGTPLEGKVDSVIVERFDTLLSIAMRADASPPLEKTIDIPEETLIARLRFRAETFAGPRDLTTRFLPQAGSNPVRYTEFTVLDGTSVVPAQPILEGGTIGIVGFFTRGDANFDKRVSISDVVFILYGLFVNGIESFPCRDAVDANDDEAMNLADVTYLVNYLFRQGPAPPPPSPPGCGLDPGTTILPVDCVRGCP